VTYIFIYKSGSRKLTDEEMARNRKDWQNWNDWLKEVYGIRTAAGKIVSAGNTEDYAGNMRGASIVEAASFAEAVEIARKSPTVKYGGTVEVFEEYKR